MVFLFLFLFFVPVCIASAPPVAYPGHHYPSPIHTSPPQRELSLKLDQQHSNLHIGESTEVECYSSDDSYTDVVWERADGRPLPTHIQVKKKQSALNHVLSSFFFLLFLLLFCYK